MSKCSAFLCVTAVFALAIACVWFTWLVMHNQQCSASTSPSNSTDDRIVDEISHSPLGRYSKAAVATDNLWCSEIGRNVLIKGGNAVDASVAALFCIGVMNPHSCGLGGGHFSTIYLKESNKCISIDARETAPSSASRDMYKDDKDGSRLGYRAIATPGEIHGAYTAFTRFGSRNMTWAQLLQPTIDMLDDGYPISPTLADKLINYKSKIANESVYYNKIAGRPFKTGEIMKQPVLSQTLQRLARSSDPIATFYRDDFVGNFINEFARAGYRDHLTRDDFANYRSIVYESQPFIPLFDPSLGNGLDVCSQPLPSGAPITISIIKAIAAFGMNSTNVTTVDAQIDFLHKFIEVSKYAYALRQELGDPAFVKNVTNIATNLTSDAFIAEVVSKVNVTAVHDDIDEYFIFNNNPIENVPEDAGTAHIAIVDDEGNAVSLTSTINHYFGAKVGSLSTGVLWNNEMDDFSQPSRANSFGLPPSVANYIAPGKRPLSSMSPLIIVDRDTGMPKLVIGASGGSRIITGVAYVASRALFVDETIKVSMDAPRLHDQLIPDRTLYETDMDERVVNRLAEMGHRMVEYSGRHSVVTAVKFDPTADEWHRWTANSDFRKGATSQPSGY